MRFARNSRNLSEPEKALVTRVFGSTLPPWNQIFVSDGLGIGDRPWTDQEYDQESLHGRMYSVNLGTLCYPDCTSRANWPGFGRIDTVFVHEMTHVWQYFHNYFVVLSSMWGQSFGDGYDYVLGSSWNDYNVEQQASLVEHWYDAGMDPASDRFQYVSKVVRRNGGAGASKSLGDLKTWSP
jgi:hypothetical protein